MNDTNKHNKLIIQPNSFSTAEYSFSLFQRDIILYIQSLVSKETEVFESIIITKRDFANFKNINYNDIKITHNSITSNFDKKLVDILLPMSLKIKLPNNFIGINLWDSVEFFDEKNKLGFDDEPFLKLNFTKSALQIFFPSKIESSLQKEFEKNYTQYNRLLLQNSKSSITRKLIELLSTKVYGASVEKPFIISIQELRLILGFSVAHRKKIKDQNDLFEIEAIEIEDILYIQNRDFKKQLERSINEINNLKSSHIVSLSMDFLKVGRKYKKVAFSFYNLNGKMPELVEKISNGFELSKPIAYLFYKVYKDEVIDVIETKLRLNINIRVDPNNNNKRVFYLKSNNEIIKNKSAYILSLFPNIKNQLEK